MDSTSANPLKGKQQEAFQFEWLLGKTTCSKVIAVVAAASDADAEGPAPGLFGAALSDWSYLERCVSEIAKRSPKYNGKNTTTRP